MAQLDTSDNQDAVSETTEDAVFPREDDDPDTSDADDLEDDEELDDEDDFVDGEPEPGEYKGDAGVDENQLIEPQFANVVEFVEQYFLPIIRRRIGDSDGGLSWDARWWAYPEVVARLTALHYAWEEARVSDSMSAMSSWWIQHLEPHLRVILDGDTGPMANAKTTRDWMGWPAMPADDVPSNVFDLIVNNG